jgi:serine/threonine protein phosphatase PrpC
VSTLTEALPALDFGPDLDVGWRSIVGPRGQVGSENQDNYLVVDVHGRAECLKDQGRQRLELADWPQGHVRLAVLDGVGGHGNGRQIAERIVEELARAPACHDQDQLNATLDAIHGRIREEFAQCEKKPGATLLLLEIPAGRNPMLYHVGDSRLYAINDQEATCLTVDHSPPTSHFMQGLIDAREWQRQAHEQDRSAISQAFGMGNNILTPGLIAPGLVALTPDNLPPALVHLADRRAIGLDAECLYLLATDGFWSYTAPQGFVGRWPDILSARRDARIDYLLDDLFEAHILASSAEEDIDNTTGILLRRRADPCC